jgi:hypothetical protein
MIFDTIKAWFKPKETVEIEYVVCNASLSDDINCTCCGHRYPHPEQDSCMRKCKYLERNLHHGHDIAKCVPFKDFKA